MADEGHPRPPRLLPPPLARPSTGIPTRSVPTPDHPCRDPRRWKHVRACVCPCGVRSQVLMQAGGSRHTLSCGVVAPPTSLGSCTSSHIWPTSLSDRALSYTDMSTLHRMTWWCVESTGLKTPSRARCPRGLTMPSHWHTCGGSPSPVHGRGRSRARRPQTLVFSLVSFYHRGAEEAPPAQGCEAWLQGRRRT